MSSIPVMRSTLLQIVMAAFFFAPIMVAVSTQSVYADNCIDQQHRQAEKALAGQYQQAHSQITKATTEGNYQTPSSQIGRIKGTVGSADTNNVLAGQIAPVMGAISGLFGGQLSGFLSKLGEGFTKLLGQIGGGGGGGSAGSCSSPTKDSDFDPRAS